MSNRKIENTAVSDLKLRTSNPRTHSKKQIRQIADSIKRFGFNNPILIDENDTIVAGQGRVEAARLLGIETVPTIRLEDLTENEIRAYVIADNRLAELAGWNAGASARRTSGASSRRPNVPAHRWWVSPGIWDIRCRIGDDQMTSANVSFLPNLSALSQRADTPGAVANFQIWPEVVISEP